MKDNIFKITEKNKKYNYKCKNNKYISNIWFDNVRDFKNGFAAIHLKDKGWNFINNKGKIISSIYFEKVYCFENEISQVCKLRKLSDCDLETHFFENYNTTRLYNYLESNIDRLAEYFIENHTFPFYYNFINNKGKLISDVWFDDAYKFIGNVVLVKLNSKYNFINKNGKIISKKWFDEIKLPDKLYGNGYKIKEHDYFKNTDYVVVKIDNDWFKLDINGNILYNN